MDQVLSGVRVLDFGRFIAAPWASALLGDLGAEVIRIEKREGGEDRWVQPVAEGGEGATFLQCNRNKESVTLDTTTEAGKEILAKLVKTADVVIANMPDAAMRANGLAYDQLKAIKPDIILGWATAYGSGGPYSDRVGFDGIGQVMSGGVSRSGTPEEPMRCVVPYVDFSTSQNLVIGILGALMHRNATGKGQMIETGLLPSALVMTNAMAIDQALLNSNRPRVGNRGTAAGPCDLYKVKDGWILMQVAGQPMFKRWCRMMDEEAWFTDPRFASDDLRAEHGDILNDRMQLWCNERTKAEASAALDAARIPVSALYSLQDVLEDEHIAQMGFFHDVEYPGAPRPAPVMETPIRMTETPPTIRTRAPILGEHTEKVMAELGYTPAEIVELRDEGII